MDSSNPESEQQREYVKYSDSGLVDSACFTVANEDAACNLVALGLDPSCCFETGSDQESIPTRKRTTREFCQLVKAFRREQNLQLVG